MCLQTKLATIIFNGHGSSNGLYFNQSGNISLDRIIAEIKTCLYAINKDFTRLNPQAVDIIFGQCYGHVNSAPGTEWSQLNVISLTSRERKLTHSDSQHHFHLENKVTDRRSTERLLMLGFPVERVYEVMNHMGRDDIEREMQNEAFMIKYGFKPDSFNHKSIESFIGLTDSLKEFLDRDCSDHELATVVFNGNGSPGGLTFLNGECIPLDRILAQVQEIIKNIHRRRQNPRHVTIVFAQAFSHKHTYSTSGTTTLEVVSLTSTRHPISLALTSFSNFSFGPPVSSHHYELENYARLKQLDQ